MAYKGDEKMSLGENIRARLDEKNAKQADLAAYCAVSHVMITKIIHGLKMPSIPLLVRIAEYFGCTVDELLGRDERRGN